MRGRGHRAADPRMMWLVNPVPMEGIPGFRIPVVTDISQPSRTPRSIINVLYNRAIFEFLVNLWAKWRQEGYDHHHDWVHFPHRFTCLEYKFILAHEIVIVCHAMPLKHVCCSRAMFDASCSNPAKMCEEIGQFWMGIHTWYFKASPMSWQKKKTYRKDVESMCIVPTNGYNW